MAQQQKIRRFVMTGAVFAITATGAWYGAGLKTQQEFKKVRQFCKLHYLLSVIEHSLIRSNPFMIHYICLHYPPFSPPSRIPSPIPSFADIWNHFRKRKFF